MQELTFDEVRIILGREETGIEPKEEVTFQEGLRTKMIEKCGATGVEFITNVADWIESCIKAGFVPMFKTKYAKKSLDNCALGVCWGAKGTIPSQWFKDIPSEDRGSNWKLLLQKYGTEKQKKLALVPGAKKPGRKKLVTPPEGKVSGKEVGFTAYAGPVPITVTVDLEEVKETLTEMGYPISKMSPKLIDNNIAAEAEELLGRLEAKKALRVKVSFCPMVRDNLDWFEKEGADFRVKDDFMQDFLMEVSPEIERIHGLGDEIYGEPLEVRSPVDYDSKETFHSATPPGPKQRQNKFSQFKKGELRNVVEVGIIDKELFKRDVSESDIKKKVTVMTTVGDHDPDYLNWKAYIVDINGDEELIFVKEEILIGKTLSAKEINLMIDAKLGPPGRPPLLYTPLFTPKEARRLFLWLSEAADGRETRYMLPRDLMERLKSLVLLWAGGISAQEINAKVKGAVRVEEGRVKVYMTGMTTWKVGVQWATGRERDSGDYIFGLLAPVEGWIWTTRNKAEALEVLRALESHRAYDVLMYYDRPIPDEIGGELTIFPPSHTETGRLDEPSMRSLREQIGMWEGVEGKTSEVPLSDPKGGFPPPWLGPRTISSQEINAVIDAKLEAKERTPAETTLTQIRPHVRKYADYLSKKTGQRFIWFSFPLQEEEGLTLRLKWIKPKRAVLNPPTFLMHIRYKRGPDLYEVQTSFWDEEMKEVETHTYEDIYADRLAEPDIFFDWARPELIKA